MVENGRVGWLKGLGFGAQSYMWKLVDAPCTDELQVVIMLYDKDQVPFFTRFFLVSALHKRLRLAACGVKSTHRTK